MPVSVCDTSTLIKLHKGGLLDCLGKLFERIYLPNGVKEECLDPELSKAIQMPFFEVRAVNNILAIGMGKGEREVISLALELDLKTVLIDDNKGFRKAHDLGLSPLQTKDILLIANKLKLLDSVQEALDKMKLRGEGIEDKEYLSILKEAGE